MHQNSQKRKHFENTIYFITTVTKDRYPYFENKTLCDLFIEELRLCKELKGFELYAFAILEDHVHLLLKPGNEFNISNVMHFIKRHFTRDANILIGINPLQQEGEDRDLRLLKIRKFMSKSKNAKLLLPQFRWQHSFHDHYIRNHKDFLSHYNYTINNHTKHDLPDDYKYTSLNYPGICDEFI